jgi:probable rRNA maturation factor
MIEINNLTRRKINETFLRKAGERTLKGEKKDLSISVVLVGRSKIKEINKEHRRKDKPTDVLSFSYGETGEVMICPEIVEKAGEFNKEMAKVLIHGILHILGYDHEKTEKEARIMQRKQDYYLLNTQKHVKE